VIVRTRHGLVQSSRVREPRSQPHLAAERDVRARADRERHRVARGAGRVLADGDRRRQPTLVPKLGADRELGDEEVPNVQPRREICLRLVGLRGRASDAEQLENGELALDGEASVVGARPRCALIFSIDSPASRSPCRRFASAAPISRGSRPRSSVRSPIDIAARRDGSRPRRSPCCARSHGRETFVSCARSSSRSRSSRKGRRSLRPKSATRSLGRRSGVWARARPRCSTW